MRRLFLLCGLMVGISAVACIGAIGYGQTESSQDHIGTESTLSLLGEIISKYGVPCRVVYIRSTYGQVQIYFDYPHLEANTPRFEPEMLRVLEPEAGLWYLDPRMPIASVDTFSDQNVCDTPGPLNDAEVTSWHGFGTFR